MQDETKKFITKIKLANGDVVFLKDADGRGLISGLDERVTSLEGTITGQLHYEVVDALPETPVENTIYLVPEEGVASGTYVEYLAYKKDGQVKLERIGTTQADFSNYYTKGEIDTKVTALNTEDARIAGLVATEQARAEGIEKNLQDAIDDEEERAKGAEKDLQDAIDAINAKDLEVTVVSENHEVGGQTATVEGQTIRGVEATGDITGSVTIAATDATVESAGKYTPAGEVAGTVVADGEISVTVKDAETATAATLTKADYTPEGTISLNVKTNESIKVKDAGTVAAFTQGAKASLTDQTTSKFATGGIVANLDTEDGECLVFTAAATADAVTDRGTFTANGDDSFTANVLPTFEAATVELSNATFTGTKAEQILVTGVDYLKQEIDAATFTGKSANISATFTGTEGNVEVEGTYSKVTTGTATVTATDVTLAVGDIVVESKDITTAAKSITTAKPGKYDVTEKAKSTEDGE